MVSSLSLSATIPIDATDRKPWDVVVVGGGPAGAATAALVAQTGRRTLLVEAKSFPRPKTCGGCLNRSALDRLASCGLDADALELLGATPLSMLRIHGLGGETSGPLPYGLALSRAVLDEALMRRAIAAGVDFLPETTAVVLADARPSQSADLLRVRLGGSCGASVVVESRIVVCADGLGHSSLRDHPELACRVREGSRIGVGAILDDAGDAYPSGLLSLVVGTGGYVGLTRVEGGRLNVAAALDPRSLARAERPAVAIRRLLEACRLPVPAELDSAAWIGTPPLTRTSRRVAGRRLFVVGDSAGYVEPFTGEGIAWALASAFAVAPLADAACDGWRDEFATAWERTYRRTVADRQWECRLLTGLLRSPRLTSLSLRLCRLFPSWPRRAIAHVAARGPAPLSGKAIRS